MKNLITIATLIQILIYSHTPGAQEHPKPKDEITSTLSIHIVGPLVTDAIAELRIDFGKHKPLIIMHTTLKPITGTKTLNDFRGTAHLYRNGKSYKSTKESTITIKETSNKYPPTYKVKLNLTLKPEDESRSIKFRKTLTIIPKTSCEQPEYAEVKLNKEDIFAECPRLAGIKTGAQSNTPNTPNQAAPKPSTPGTQPPNTP